MLFRASRQVAMRRSSQRGASRPIFQRLQHATTALLIISALLNRTIRTVRTLRAVVPIALPNGEVGLNFVV
jgi:hypothetical protein